MSKFVRISDDGQFTLNGKRWLCNSAVYFGRFPGTCATDWMRDDFWELNVKDLDFDFELMARIGINHAALFLHGKAFFNNGRLIQQGVDRLNTVIDAARRNDIRVSLFVGPFIDTPEHYTMITGLEWEYGNKFLPSRNPALHAAYVQQMAPFAQMYKDDPSVMAYTDRIDRYFSGFENTGIPFNLKEEWTAWLQQRYGNMDSLREVMGGKLEGDPRDFNEVLLPQESKWNASLFNPLAYDYILMQKSDIGQAQARFDAEINALAPNQFVWTPFEGNTVTWAMLDGFNPETKKLQAVWMEYYFFEVTRVNHVLPFSEWSHTREPVHRRLSHELPVVYTAAYYMARYVKQSVQRPVVLCHGAWIDKRDYGMETYEQQVAITDRMNAACLAADIDGWHYWNWREDNCSWTAHKRERFRNSTKFYSFGETCGMIDFEGYPRPMVSLVQQYTQELKRRTQAGLPMKKSDVLVLSSAPRMYTLFRRMAVPTAAALTGALMRLGVEPDVLWTAQNEVHISEETLATYKCIAIADNMYERDHRDMPEKLLRWVENGGTLYFALDRFDSFKDEHGIPYDNPALTTLSGVDPHGTPNWPDADTPCLNWPYETPASEERNVDLQGFSRLAWGVCPEFRIFAPYPEDTTVLGVKSTDDDNYCVIPALVPGAEVIAVGKFVFGTAPFIYRHHIGQGMVYVNAWTNNIIRDCESQQDYGGYTFDWVLSLPLQTSGARDVNLLSSSGLWLRNTWGYFWKTRTF